eukprot:PITA_19747
MPLVEKEIKKSYDAKIIVPIRYSKWVSNIVPTRKKTSEIRVCIDFRNLNKVSLKENYPLPKMDHMMQWVVGSSRICLLHGFLGYNQVLVHLDDQDKASCTTPYGTFMYVKMPFGLMNAGATFQRAMDIYFSDEIGHFIVIYLDDITIFSKSDEEHLEHLRRVFEKCRNFGILLNPKKTLFGIEEGKLLATSSPKMKNKEGYEQPIAFFSKDLRDASLKYNIMEKQAFSLVKAIKDFRVYILHSHIIAHVPNIVVKDIPTQNGPDGKRGKWIAVILEYDIDIKPTKLTKESNFNPLDINVVFPLDDLEELTIPPIDKAYLNSPWYVDLLYVLFNLNAPPGLSKTNARFLKLKAAKFFIIYSTLYWKYVGGVLLKCFLKDDVDKVMHKFHEGDYGGHLY